MNCTLNASRFRRLKPALESKGDVIPGLRSLRSLTRGYHLSSLRDSLMGTSGLTLCCVITVSAPNKSLYASGGGSRIANFEFRISN